MGNVDLHGTTTEQSQDFMVEVLALAIPVMEVNDGRSL